MNEYFLRISDEKFPLNEPAAAAEAVPPPKNRNKKFHPEHKFPACKFQTPPPTAANRTFDRHSMPIYFRVSPETLLNLAATVVDASPLPNVYEWNTHEVCRWLRRYGYPQYMHTFKVNYISGPTLLLLQADALSAMNIKDFVHVQHISAGIRQLFYFQLTKFTRSISLPPQCLAEIYKLFRVQSGRHFEQMKRTDLWHEMQLVRPREHPLDHWDALEAFLRQYCEQLGERFGSGPQQTHRLYYCAPELPSTERPTAAANTQRTRDDTTIMMHCYKSCQPPCECHWKRHEYKPRRKKLACLAHLDKSAADPQLPIVPPVYTMPILRQHSSIRAFRRFRERINIIH